MSGIDPRLRARRIEVRRAEGRRRLRVLVMVLAAASVGALGWVISQSPLLDVDHVSVAGLSAPSQAAVREAAAIDPGTPLVAVDVDAAAEAVASLAWVESATVERRWPATVEVSVVPRVPVAQMPVGDGTYVLVDSAGVVTSSATSIDANDLPVIAVVSSSDLGSVETRVLAALPLATAMPTDLKPWVSSINVAQQGVVGSRLSLDLSGGAVAKLGGEHDLADKLDSLRAVLAGTDLTCIAEIDVTVADLPTVMRDPDCEAARLAEAAAAENT